jgi:hypothetical protein
MSATIEELKQLWRTTPCPMRTQAHDTRGLTDMLQQAQKILPRPIKAFVEIGSYSGEGMYTICEALKPDIYITVDPYENGYCEDDVASRTDLLRPELVLNEVIKAVREQFGTETIKIRGTSTNMVEVLNKLNIEVDMFYIDGDHSYVGVYTDMLNIKNYTKKRPYILAGHDYVHDRWDVPTVCENFGYPSDKLLIYEDTSWLAKEPV